MFSTGQITFGIIFAIVFAIIIGIMYRKDLKLHKANYKGTLWVLLAFIGFISLIAAIKFIFK
jgi:tellurite resistance protein TehA-like permease